jgi:hypothetical protein
VAAAGILPVSGLDVWLREATGEDELLVVESSGPAPTAILALATRLASDPSGRPIDWPALPAADLGAAALLIRSSWLGRTIRTEALCTAPSCGEPIEVVFGITAYLHYHRPRRFRGAAACEAGWYGLNGTEVRFRMPTISDLLAALEAPDAAALLHERCVRPPGPATAVARRIDRALQALAPRLDDDIGGSCPSCGTFVELHFEPVSYVLAELRDAATLLYAHVHELALAYHWSEQAILALDRRRRAGYVELIRGVPALV